MCSDCRRTPRVVVEQPPGVQWKIIPLPNKGLQALVDDCDYEQISKHRWYAWWNPNTQSYYAVRMSASVDGRRISILMHREVMGLCEGDGQMVDHKDRNTLDNRRSNLRFCDNQKNQWNRITQRRNKSGHKGVHYSKQHGKWLAYIWEKGKNVYLGSRPTAKQAHEELYAPAAIRIHGEFVRLK